MPRFMTHLIESFTVSGIGAKFVPLGDNAGPLHCLARQLESDGETARPDARTLTAAIVRAAVPIDGMQWRRATPAGAYLVQIR
jgi:hypothetical protein